MSAATPAVDLHGRSPWSILPPLCLGFFMIMVDTTIVNIAVPTLQEAFDASLVTVGWVNSAYLLTFAVLLLVTGRLGDRFGPRPVFVTGLVVFTLASLACGLAGSVGVLIAARAVQGIGGALMTPQTMAMITRAFPSDKRGAALGVWGSVAGVATIMGPVLGGILVETVGWEWIFYVNIPVGVVALWLSLTRLPALPRTRARSTCPASCCPSSAWACSCSACRRDRATGGGRSSGRSRCPSSSAPVCWSPGPSCCGSTTWGRTRCCRCACSCTATSRSPTWPVPP